MQFDKGIPGQGMAERFKFWAKSNFPQAIIRFCLDSSAPQKTVLLTFDDGPVPGPTMEILDILDLYDIKALFFVVGVHARMAPFVLKEIIERGHTIGNHTHTHEKGGNHFYGHWVNELETCQETVLRETGHEPEYFRPPYGKLSLTLFAAAVMRRLSIIKWSFDVGDFSFMKNSSSAHMASNWVQNLQSHDIVLMHDKCTKTPHVLEMALPQLIDNGFRFDGLKYI